MDAAKRVLQVGDALPNATLYESTGFLFFFFVFFFFCLSSRSPHSLSDTVLFVLCHPNLCKFRSLLVVGKTVIFGVPGAFTSTCSEQHVPGFLKHVDAFRQNGVDTIICVSVNDGWVMGEYAKSQKAEGKIRFLGDGDAEFAKALGLDYLAPGMGTRCRRFSMLVSDGKIQFFNVEQPRQFVVSSAEHLLKQLTSKQ
jgi:peroxiredoxin